MYTLSLKPQSNPHLTEEEEAGLREMKGLIKEHDSDLVPFHLTSDPEFFIDIPLYS